VSSHSFSVNVCSNTTAQNGELVKNATRDRRKTTNKYLKQLSVVVLSHHYLRMRPEPDCTVGGPGAIFTGGPLWRNSWRHRLSKLRFR